MRSLLCAAALIVSVNTTIYAEGPPAFSLKWGTLGSGDGQFLIPSGVAVDPSGNVFVADRDNYRVQKFDANGGFLLKWGSFGSGDGQFEQPQGLDVDAAGNVYIADYDLDRIQKFDSNGNFLTKWGSTGTGNGQFDTPSDVSVDGFGNVYVVDLLNNRVQKFTTNGTYRSQIATTGAVTVATNAEGEVYVFENGSSRVQKFDSTGTFILQWGSFGSGDGQFGFSNGIDVDAAGDVYVAGVGNNRVQKFDSDGTFLTKWGTMGSGDGQFSSPYDIATYGDFVYVIEQANNRVQKFIYTRDLVVAPFTTPAESRVVCDPLSISMTVANLGNQALGAFDVTLRVSEDSTITGSDFLLTTINLPGLGAGKDSTITLSQDLPHNAPRGSVYLGAIADDADVIAETDEANNTAFNSFEYQVPLMEFARDVPGDEGGQVYLAWWGSPLDLPAQGGLITQYSIWRAIGPATAEALIKSGDALPFVPGKTAISPEQPLVRVQSSWCGTFFWQMIGTEAVWHLPTYGSIQPSLFDSTSVSGEYQYFQVIAHTSDPLVFYTSNPDSGRSVDNIGPAMPMNFVGQQEFTPEGITLTWDPNVELDLDHYALYKSLDPAFVPGPGNFEATVEDATYFDSEWRWNNQYYYKLSAVDLHENESDFAVVGSGDVTAIDDDRLPVTNHLSQNQPNPFNPSTLIRFGLSTAGDVTVMVYDASGRPVRTLLRDNLREGFYTVDWDGRNDRGQHVASGIYFYRLTAGAFSQTRKMVLLR